jgi:hypothetical protein
MAKRATKINVTQKKSSANSACPVKYLPNEMFTPLAQLNVYPVKSLLHLFLWGGACLSGVKSFLHLFLWGGAYFIGVLQKWKETNLT